MYPNLKVKYQETGEHWTKITNQNYDTGIAIHVDETGTTTNRSSYRSLLKETYRQNRNTDAIY